MKKSNTLLFFAGLMLFLGQNFSVDAGNISDTVDVTHYEIHLTEVDTDSETISGFATLQITPADGSLNGAALELMDLSVDSVFVSAQPVVFTHDDPLLTIPFEEGLDAGDTTSVTVYYHGSPFSENWGGFHFAGDYAFNLGVGFESIPHNLGKSWFPCVDDFVDRAYYDFYISTEDPQMAVCGGILQSKRKQDAKTVYHWKMENTIPTYLASVAIGEYALFEDEYEGMERNIPIKIWVRPSEEDDVEGSFTHLKDILQVFEEHWGPYPFSRVGYVSTAQGAMEHATNIAYPYGTINGNTNYEWLYAHELSHMWLGDKVTCSTAGDMWLNEGWAVFNEFLYREGIYDTAGYMAEYNNLHEDVLQFAHTSGEDGDYYALYDIPQELTYGTTVYDKGALVVHTLRHYLGDETFYPAMKAYLESFAFQPASSYDLQDFLTEQTGMDMEPFFENWVFTPGFPHFEIDSVVDTEGMQQVFIQQKRKGRELFSENNILEITFMDENWETWTDTMMVSGSHDSKSFDAPFTPQVVMPDYYNKMADATTDRHITIHAPGEISMSDVFLNLDVESAPDSAFLRVTHNWAAPDTLEEAIPGLRVSDYRYWKIDGLFPEGFSTSCRFHYSQNNYLDHTLILDDDDAITLLYREDQSHPWQEIEHTQIGPSTFGYLEVDELQKGEYTMAVWKAGFTGREEQEQATVFKVIPNPAIDIVKLALPVSEKGVIEIYSSTGQMVQQLEKPAGRQNLTWRSQDVSPGTYIARWITEGKIKASEKIVIK